MPDFIGKAQVLQLSEENLKLTAELRSRELLLAQKEEEYKSLELTLRQKLDADQLLLQKQETEINRLSSQLEKLAQTAKAETVLVEELTLLNVQKDVLQKQLDVYLRKVIDLENESQNERKQLQILNEELSSIQRLYKNEQLEKINLQLELNAVNEKIRAAFSAADLSRYFTNAINQFNEAVNTADANINYIINGMDVEMKAHLTKTEENNLLMTAPSPAAGSETALSSIRFSITAVPKDMASDE